MLDAGRADPLRARRLLARYGAPLLNDLLDHKEADLWGKGETPPEASIDRLARLREAVEREQSSPHRLQDLAIGGDDLLALGLEPGPRVGETLRALLADVVRDPELNTRDELLARARRRLR
jgi:tRNA nucleotidyltransferase (CCA-adding enzyme)